MTMKRILFLLCCAAAILSCDKQKGIVGEPREFKVTSTTKAWPSASSEAISRTYTVTVAGGDGSRKWTVELMDGTQGFILEPDYAAGQFTVSIPANTGKVSLTDWVVVTYSGEMKYIKVTSMSEWFSVAEGTDIGDGTLAYLIRSDGTAEYTGEMSNPSGKTPVAEYVSGYNGFTPVFTEDALCFTAEPNTNFVDLTAVYKIYQQGKENNSEQTYTITVIQKGLVLPEGAIGDMTAPGGYYYPLNCGIDIAGVNITVDGSKCWNDYCDPDRTLEEESSVNQMAPVNPCPSGWALPTEAQLRTLAGSGVAVLREDEGLFWSLRDGKTSIDTKVLWGATNLVAMSCETRANSVNAVWRLQVKVSQDKTTGKFVVGAKDLYVSGHSREGDTFSAKKAILRCVRAAEQTTESN